MRCDEDQITFLLTEQTECTHIPVVFWHHVLFRNAFVLNRRRQVSSLY